MVNKGSFDLGRRHGPAGMFLNDHRRALILALIDTNSPLSVEDTLFRGRPEEITEELRQVHLPLLEQAGYIEWDREADEISKGPNFEDAKELVGSLKNRDIIHRRN